MGRLQSIQILRFIAAAMVVMLHANSSLQVGAAGVDIFFVISGFIIASIANGKDPGVFLWDRVRRVYPIYLLCSLPYAWFVIAAHGVDWQRLAATVTLWPVYADYVAPYLRPGWSLCFEMLFYSVTALVLWRPAFLKVAVAGYVAAMVLAFSTGWPLFRFIGNPIILEFGMGVIIARMPRSSISVGAGAIALAAALLIASAPSSGGRFLMESLADLSAPERAIVWGCPAALLVFGAIQLEPVLRGRLVRIFAYLGDASYSAYLIHVFALAAFSAFLWWPLAAASAIGVGVIQYRYVEQPLTRRLKRRPGGQPLLPLQPVAIPAE